MGALLALIPTKDYIYAGLIAALLIAFGVYTHHERTIGADQVRVADAKLTAAQTALATEKTQHGLDNSLTAEKLFVGVTTAPPAPDAPHLFVRDCARPAAIVVRSADGATVSVPTADSSVDHAEGVDIGPALDTIGRNSDAQVTYLQSILKSCVDIGACKLTP